MLFDIELHMVAGIGALLLGIGALLSGPSRIRNRLFFLLCAALSTWMLGVACSTLWEGSHGRLDLPWQIVFLLGACAAAPLGLHFFSRVVRLDRSWFQKILALSYATAAVLWITSWTPLYGQQPHWNVIAMAILGSILLLGAVPLWRHVIAMGPGLERRVYRLFLRGALVTIIGGLSDFLPRGGVPIPKIGPASVLIFLLVLSAIVIRHRFLDVAGILARAVALGIGAVAVSSFLYAIAWFSGLRWFPLFLGTLLVLAAVGPAGRFLMAGSRSLFRSGNPLTTALHTLSQNLPLARDRKALVEAIEEGLKLLPGEVRLGIYVRQKESDSYRLAYRAGMDALPQTIAKTATLPRFLESERTLVTHRFLEDEFSETRGARKQMVGEALEEFRNLGLRHLVPIFYGGQLAAWSALGSDLPEESLTIDVVSTFRVVASQALESLQRVETIEEAKRREALVAVGEMAGGLAHEVRNPVGAIRGAAQVLTEERDPDRAREMLEVIQEETDRLGRVVGEFLGYAGPVSPQKKAVDLAESAREALKAAEMAGKGLRGRVDVAPGTPPALGDPDQLQRAFRNLVWNARDAAGPEGQLWVRVNRQGPGQVAVRFEDDGPGIPPEMQSRLFQPFQSTKTGGTGLGLALVHRVIEAHGGKIWVEEPSGKGAAFTLVLPAAEVP